MYIYADVRVERTNNRRPWTPNDHSKRSCRALSSRETSSLYIIVIWRKNPAFHEKSTSRKPLFSCFVKLVKVSLNGHWNLSLRNIFLVIFLSAVLLEHLLRVQFFTKNRVHKRDQFLFYRSLLIIGKHKIN